MKDTYYFSHDYNPRGDEKIQGVLFEMGWEGYGLYWGLIELLYQNDGYLQLQYKRIAFELRTDYDKIEKLINDFDLFMINENMFTSKSVLYRLKKRKEKSSQTRKAAKTRWNREKQSNADAIQMESESNAIKESKVKDNKLKKNKIYIEEIITYFNEKTEKNFTSKSKTNNSVINARLNEGFKIEDFKKIIDNKCKSWLGTKMDEYLRPETLFCSKHFESYLNEKPEKTTSDVTSDYLKKLEDENK